MNWRYSNWLITLLLLGSLLVVALSLWLTSDQRLSQRVGGQLWSYKRETYNQAELASLLLSTRIHYWQEQGRLRLLSNHGAQMDIELTLMEDHGPAKLYVSIQGNWQLSDNYLILKSDHYSALPLDEAGQKVLKNHASALQDLWLTLFNRSRLLSLLGNNNLLLSNDGGRPWVLTRQVAIP
ncbi:MAG: hypothetical protein ACRCRW_16440 [Aeromonadaceae bacterium]